MSLQIQTTRFLSEFSTFSIGGPIRYFIAVKNLQEMKRAYLFAEQKNVPSFLVGKGSNCLFDDRGFEGLVILNQIDHCFWSEEGVSVGSGFSFSRLGTLSAKKGFSGLEFASGIPASVGGAIFMNAGAHGQETAACLKRAVFLTPEGAERSFLREDLSFGYRTSPFQKMSGAIVEAFFELSKKASVREEQLKLLVQRKKTQPLKEKSIGCIFRNPEGQSAARLIDQAGLKGVCVGGAMVSPLHANFIINQGGARSEEVKALIEKIQREVFSCFGIELELEVRFVSF